MSKSTRGQVEPEKQPGKTRTWWHPLLVRLLDFELHGAYEVRAEVNVGRMPLRVDIVLIRREHGELSPTAKHDLPSLIRRLNRFTLVEFKGPTDTLAAGDLDSLFGYAHLFRAQQQRRIPRSELNLIVLAPSRTQSFSDDLESLGIAAKEEEPGILRLEHPVFPTWLIETDRITGPNEPVLSLFSRVFLKERSRIIRELKEQPSAKILIYTLQQVQFGEAKMKLDLPDLDPTDLKEMQQFIKDLWAELLPGIPAQERLRGIPAEERLRGIPAEERLRGIPAEEIIEALDERERTRIRMLLEHPKAHSSRKKRKRK